MPYSEYVVKDRKAIGQIKYQIRRFAKQMREAGVAQEDMDRINVAFDYAFQLAAGSHDFDDDGARIYYGEEQ